MLYQNICTCIVLATASVLTIVRLPFFIGKMNFLMLLQIAFTSEVLSTTFTVKVLASRMCPHVTSQITFLAKGLLTISKSALKQFQFLMNAKLVHFERILCCKLHLTYVTGELTGLRGAL